MTFIDTPGAWAGLGAEERGQSEAIARNLLEMSQLTVPIIATVIGEGGSGGALALGVADRVLMLQNAVYSVITVEGCAAILWKDGKSPEMREKAASALKITAQDLLELRIIDEIIPEPPGGAHADQEATAAAVGEALLRNLDELRRLKPDKLVRRRREKYSAHGAVRGMTETSRQRAASGPHLVEVTFKGNRQGVFHLGVSRCRRRSKTHVIVDADRGEDLGVRERDRRSRDDAQVAARRTARRTADPIRAGAACRDRRRHRERRAALRADEDNVRRRAIEKVRAQGLEMKVSDTEWQWDRKKLTIYFTAEKRVDFRQLVRQLEGLFGTRVQMWHIGVRDEAKRLDGIGRCARQFCSASWLPGTAPVKSSVAKDQRLSTLNPSQISGSCGRLMCCLRYEHEFYVKQRKRFPKEGKIVVTLAGEEKIVSNDIFREQVTLRGATGEMRVVPLAQFNREVGGDRVAATADLAPERRRAASSTKGRTTMSSRIRRAAPRRGRIRGSHRPPAPNAAGRSWPARVAQDAPAAAASAGDRSNASPVGSGAAATAAARRREEQAPETGDPAGRRRRRRGRRGGRRGREGGGPPKGPSGAPAPPSRTAGGELTWPIQKSSTSRPRSTTPTVIRISATRSRKSAPMPSPGSIASCGRPVHFLIGMDEHGQKVAQTAAARGVEPQAVRRRRRRALSARPGTGSASRTTSSCAPPTPRTDAACAR